MGVPERSTILRFGVILCENNILNRLYIKSFAVLAAPVPMAAVKLCTSSRMKTELLNILFNDSVLRPPIAYLFSEFIDPIVPYDMNL